MGSYVRLTSHMTIVQLPQMARSAHSKSLQVNKLLRAMPKWCYPEDNLLATSWLSKYSIPIWVYYYLQILHPSSPQNYLPILCTRTTGLTLPRYFDEAAKALANCSMCKNSKRVIAMTSYWPLIRQLCKSSVEKVKVFRQNCYRRWITIQRY